MKIYKPNTKQADAVLKIVTKMFDKTEGEDIVDVHPYMNCREAGHHIRYVTGHHRAVSFSENRNSDNIVVYYGVAKDFAANTNIACDEVWQRSRYFGCGSYDQAAQFIWDYLVRGLTPTQE
jgi:hypothetical protein